MLLKLDDIIIYSLLAFFLSLILYPLYIKLLEKIKAGKTIREDSTSGGKAEIFSKLHQHKTGTPTMGGGLIIFVVAVLVLFSYVLNWLGLITFTLVERSETYIILFAFFSMGFLGLIDDYLNIKGVGKVKGLTAKMKILWMFLFSAFISYWFYFRLGVSHIDLRPLFGTVDLGFFYILFTFILTVTIVNAINITDGLDGLVGGLMIIVLFVLGIITFFYGWYLATTVIGVVLGATLAFLWFNINPAKIFLGDSGALAFGGLVSSLIYLIDIRVGILLPFLILFAVFFLEITTSFIQIFFKRVFNKKIFPIAPFHHLLEYKGYPEHTIVMKLWVLQGVLAGVTLIMIFYQFHLVP